MKKGLKTILLVLVCAGVLFASALIYGRLSFMSELEIEHPEIALGPLPMSILQAAYLAPDMPFRIDMGASANTISHEYLERLKKAGCCVDSTFALMYFRTAYGDRRLTTRRYRVDMPVYAYDIRVDNGRVISTIDTTNIINHLRNIDFVLVSGNELPRLGRAFFRKFYLEYDHDLRSLRFHTQMPAGYEEISGLTREFSVFSEPAIFLRLGVDERYHDFFLNSSMPRAGILMPSDEAPEPDGKNVFDDFIQSHYGRFPTVIDYDAWVDWNDRSGNNVCYYCDYGVHRYALNPFNFLTQDAVFDFDNRRVFLRPYSDKERRKRTNDAFVAAVSDSSDEN